jgi:excisionase family DNA binding protein
MRRVRIGVSRFVKEMAMKNEPARTVKEAAEELGLSPATIRLWIRQRKIGYVRLGRAVRIPPSEIRRIVERGTVAAIA